MHLSLLVPAAIACVTALVAAPYFIRFASRVGITAIDQQKKGKPLVPTSGGISVALGFFAGVMAFIAINTFVTRAELSLLHILAATLTIFLIAVIGFFDDIYIGKTRRVNESGALEYRVGLRQWVKPVLSLPAAVPLMVVSAGVTAMSLPFVGKTEFGLFYPVFLIPLAVVVVSNATNMLAGVNGLETGMMLVAMLALGAYALVNGHTEGALIAFTAAGALLAFLFFNWFPAKILPGDSLTYFTGGAFASAVIVGNMEKFGFIIFLPWIAEIFLKLRGRLSVRGYGELQKDGTIAAPYEKIYSLTHVAMKFPKWIGLKKNFREWQVAGILVLGEAVLCVLALLFVSG
jgi:UDP-N-acetylglucosamine--dolichyl-phosphate N-acetylglucosaminephosphotransferase